jgi:phage gp36-like protein
MGAYTDEVILGAAFPDIDTTPISPDLLRWAADMANAEVDGNLGGIYLLPFPGRVPILERLASDIAVYLILTARPFTAPPRPVETAWQNRYNAAVSMLQRIASGEMALVDESGAVIDTTEGVGDSASATPGRRPSSTCRPSARAMTAPPGSMAGSSRTRRSAAGAAASGRGCCEPCWPTRARCCCACCKPMRT